MPAVDAKAALAAARNDRATHLCRRRPSRQARPRPAASGAAPFVGHQEAGMVHRLHGTARHAAHAWDLRG